MPPKVQEFGDLPSQISDIMQSMVPLVLGESSLVTRLFLGRIFVGIQKVFLYDS